MKLSKMTQKDAKKIVAGIKASIELAKMKGQADLVAHGQQLLNNMPEEIRELVKGGH